MAPLTTIGLSGYLHFVREKLTACLLLALTLGFGLDLGAASQSICAVTFESCCNIAGDGCETGCCNTGERDCCFEVPENNAPFVAPQPFPPVDSPFLADLPRDLDRFSLACDSETISPANVAPDPPPPSGRVLLTLIERHLI